MESWSSYDFHPDKLPWCTTVTCSAFEVRSSNLNVICCFRCFASCHALPTCALAPRGLHHHWLPSQPGSLNQIEAWIVSPPVLDHQKSLPGKLHSHNILDHNEQNEFGMVVAIWRSIHDQKQAIVVTRYDYHEFGNQNLPKYYIILRETKCPWKSMARRLPHYYPIERSCKPPNTPHWTAAAYVPQLCDIWFQKVLCKDVQSTSTFFNVVLGMFQMFLSVLLQSFLNVSLLCNYGSPAPLGPKNPKRTLHHS